MHCLLIIGLLVLCLCLLWYLQVSSLTALYQCVDQTGKAKEVLDAAVNVWRQRKVRVASLSSYLSPRMLLHLLCTLQTVYGMLATSPFVDVDWRWSVGAGRIIKVSTGVVAALCVVSAETLQSQRSSFCTWTAKTVRSLWTNWPMLYSVLGFLLEKSQVTCTFWLS